MFVSLASPHSMARANFLEYSSEQGLHSGLASGSQQGSGFASDSILRILPHAMPGSSALTSELQTSFLLFLNYSRVDIPLLMTWNKLTDQKILTG